MDCASCTNHINLAVSQFQEVVCVSTSYEKENTSINFDSTKTSLKTIKKTIKLLGYETE